MKKKAKVNLFKWFKNISYRVLMIVRCIMEEGLCICLI